MNRPTAAFFGTPEAAVPSLRALHAALTVKIVITRPDRPKGRSGAASPPPVKKAALELGLRVAAPQKRDDLVRVVSASGPLDVAVVTAFGMVIPGEALTIPAAGFLNVHFSLLPRWRGASPVTAAIAAGDDETGVTVMSLDEGLDTGPLIAARPTPIGAAETGGELTRRLADLGASLLGEVLAPWVAGELTATPQPGGAATNAPRIRPQDLAIDLFRPAAENCRRIRAFAPEPGAFVIFDGERTKLLTAIAHSGQMVSGTLLVEGTRLLIGSGGTTLEVLSLQPAGKRSMSVAEWLRGRRSGPTLVT
ncbi:MAG: methionyl-tRNA formyltransferase [Actinomycetota bacterium]